MWKCEKTRMCCEAGRESLIEGCGHSEKISTLFRCGARATRQQDRTAPGPLFPVPEHQLGGLAGQPPAAEETRHLRPGAGACRRHHRRPVVEWMNARRQFL